MPDVVAGQSTNYKEWFSQQLSRLTTANKQAKEQLLFELFNHSQCHDFLAMDRDSFLQLIPHFPDEHSAQAGSFNCLLVSWLEKDLSFINDILSSPNCSLLAYRLLLIEDVMELFAKDSSAGFSFAALLKGQVSSADNLIPLLNAVKLDFESSQLLVKTWLFQFHTKPDSLKFILSKLLAKEALLDEQGQANFNLIKQQLYRKSCPTGSIDNESFCKYVELFGSATHFIGWLKYYRKDEPVLYQNLLKQIPQKCSKEIQEGKLFPALGWEISADLLDSFEEKWRQSVLPGALSSLFSSRKLIDFTSLAKILLLSENPSECCKWVAMQPVFQPSELLALLFLALCRASDKNEILFSMDSKLEQYDVQERKAFVRQVLQARGQSLNEMGLSYLDSFLIRYSEEFKDDIDIIEAYIDAIDKFIKGNDTPEHSEKALTWLENLMNSLCSTGFYQNLLQSRIYGSLLDYLVYFEHDHYHFFFRLCSEVLADALPKELSRSHVFQRKVKELLLHCPDDMQEDQFQRFFSWLNEGMKQALLKDCFHLNSMRPLQQELLPMLSRTMPMQQLCQISADTSNCFVTEAILQRIEQFSQQSEQDIRAFFETLKYSTPILDWLMDNKTLDKERELFFNLLFDVVCQNDARQFDRLLSAFGEEGRWLVFLANAAIQPQQKHCIEHLLEVNPKYKDVLQQEMKKKKALGTINQDSFLSDWYVNALAHPLTDHSPCLSYFSSVPVEQQARLFEKQNIFHEQWQNFRRGIHALSEYNGPVNANLVKGVLQQFKLSIPKKQRAAADALLTANLNSFLLRIESSGRLDNHALERLKQDMGRLFYGDNNIDDTFQERYQQFLAGCYKSSLANRDKALIGKLLSFLMYSPSASIIEKKQIDIDTWLSACPIALSEEFLQPFIECMGPYESCLDKIKNLADKKIFEEVNVGNILTRLAKENAQSLKTNASILKQMGFRQLYRLYSLASQSAEQSRVFQPEINPLMPLWIQDELHELGMFFDRLKNRAREFPLSLLSPCLSDITEFEARLKVLFDLNLSDDLNINILNQYVHVLFGEEGKSALFQDVFIEQYIRLIEKYKGSTEKLLSALSPPHFERMLKYAFKKPEKHLTLLQFYYHEFPQSELLKTGIENALTDYGCFVTNQELKSFVPNSGWNKSEGDMNRLMLLYKLKLLIDNNSIFHPLISEDESDNFQWTQDFVMDLALYTALSSNEMTDMGPVSDILQYTDVSDDNKANFYKEIFDVYFTQKSKSNLAQKAMALEWRSEVFEEPKILREGLAYLIIFNPLDDKEDFNALLALMDKIKEKNQMDDFLKEVKAIEQMNQDAKDKLIKLLFHSTAFDEQTDFCVSEMSLDCFSQLLDEDKNRYELLTVAVNEPEFVNKVNESKQWFLDTLEQKKISLDTAADLYQRSAGNKKMGSLLMLNLLKQEKFLEKMDVPAVNLTTGTMEQHRPAQVLLEKLHLDDLNLETLSKLPSKVKINLLCSSRFFHRWNSIDYFKVLCPGSEKIRFLLKHHSYSPNFIHMLFPMVEQGDSVVNKFLDELKEDERDQWFAHLLSYAAPDLFKVFYQQQWAKYLSDTHLVQLIKSYHYKGPKTEEFNQFIKAVYDNMKERQCELSLNCLWNINLMFKENGWADVEKELAGSIQSALKATAKVARTELFYEEGVFNFQLAVQTAPDISEAAQEPVSTCFDRALQSIGGAFDKKTQPLPAADEQNASIFECYLQSFSNEKECPDTASESDNLPKLIKNYLNAFTGRSDRSPLYQTAERLNSDKMPQVVKKQFFSQLKAMPVLHDASTVKEMLVDDVDTTLRKLSRQMDYDAFISLTEKAACQLPEKEHSAVKQAVKQAQKDSQFEKSLSQVHGMFSGIRIWYKRCKYYGFSGFFTPRQSHWVRGFEQKVEQGAAFKRLFTKNESLTLADKLREDLKTTDSLTLPQTLKHFNLAQDGQTESLELRASVDAYYEQLKKDASQSSRLDSLQSEFEKNRHFLLELMLAKLPQEEIKQRLGRMTGLDVKEEYSFLKEQFDQPEVANDLLNIKPGSSDGFIKKASQLGKQVADVGVNYLGGWLKQLPYSEKVTKTAESFYKQWWKKEKKEENAGVCSAAASSSSCK